MYEKIGCRQGYALVLQWDQLEFVSGKQTWCICWNRGERCSSAIKEPIEKAILLVEAPSYWSPWAPLLCSHGRSKMGWSCRVSCIKSFAKALKRDNTRVELLTVYTIYCGAVIMAVLLVGCVAVKSISFVVTIRLFRHAPALPQVLSWGSKFWLKRLGLVSSAKFEHEDWDLSLIWTMNVVWGANSSQVHSSRSRLVSSLV